MSRVGNPIFITCLLLGFACKQEQPPAPATTKAAVATSQPASKPATAQPAAVGAKSDPAKGKSHYMRACAPCHGLDGSGAQMRTMLPKIGDLTSDSTHARMSDNEIVNLIKKGRGKMPSLEKSLTGDQINQIVAYIRTLNKG